MKSLNLIGLCAAFGLTIYGCNQSSNNPSVANPTSTVPQIAQTKSAEGDTPPNSSKLQETKTTQELQKTTTANRDREEQPSNPLREGRSSQEITDFIPQGWQIENEVSGDLSNDGKADRVLQIVEVGDSWERPRSLLILKANASGWEQIATAPKLLICTSCAGTMGGPKGQHIRLTIEDGVLIVKQLAGSRGAIAMTHRFWLDQASQKIVLIGEDLKPYDRANGNEIIDSRNFLTGKQIIEEYQGQGNGQKKLIRTQTLKISRELPAIESVDIETARSSAPELPF